MEYRCAYPPLGPGLFRCLMKLAREPPHFVHDPQQLAAPRLFDLLFGIAAADKFQCHTVLPRSSPPIGSIEIEMLFNVRRFERFGLFAAGIEHLH